MERKRTSEKEAISKETMFTILLLLVLKGQLPLTAVVIRCVLCLLLVLMVLPPPPP